MLVVFDLELSISDWQATKKSTMESASAEKDPSRWDTQVLVTPPGSKQKENNDAQAANAGPHEEGEEEAATQDEDIDEWTADPELFSSPCHPHAPIIEVSDDEATSQPEPAAKKQPAAAEKTTEQNKEVPRKSLEEALDKAEEGKPLTDAQQDS